MFGVNKLLHIPRSNFVPDIFKLYGHAGPKTRVRNGLIKVNHWSTPPYPNGEDSIIYMYNL